MDGMQRIRTGKKRDRKHKKKWGGENVARLGEAPWGGGMLAGGTWHATATTPSGVEGKQEAKVAQTKPSKKRINNT